MITSWGNIFRSNSCHPVNAEMDHLEDVFLCDPKRDAQSVLPYGMGRSYGDSCLLSGGTIIKSRLLDKLESFDRDQGLIVCQSGVNLEELLDVIVEAGWFLPVTPGTKFVTVGGAIANDVHGKNHHKRGTFGCHVKWFELLRSDGETMICSPDQNQELFAATVGGLGLTGFITKVALQLIPIKSARIDAEYLKMENLDEFFEISEASDKDYEYTVAWIDCMAAGNQLGRGIYMRGNHAADGNLTVKVPRSLLSIPFDAPEWLLNEYSIKAFNQLYYHKQFSKLVRSTAYYHPFFYPLDAINEWNRLYGRSGFFQYQFVIPQTEKEALRSIFEKIQASGMGSFLAVLKLFGEPESPGMLSFPQPGYTLALDFGNRGEKTRALFAELDQIIVDKGGRIYPAKDACMSSDTFRKGFPNYIEFAKHIDPKFSSDFWRRVNS